MINFFYVSNLCCFPQFSRAYYHILYLLWSSPWTAHRLTASHLALLYSVVSKALSTLSSLYCLSILYQYFLSYICCCDPRLPYFSCSAHPTLLVQPSSLFQLVDDLVYHYIIGIILPTYVHSVQLYTASSSQLSPFFPIVIPTSASSHRTLHLTWDHRHIPNNNSTTRISHNGLSNPFTPCLPSYARDTLDLHPGHLPRNPRVRRRAQIYPSRLASSWGAGVSPSSSPLACRVKNNTWFLGERGKTSLTVVTSCWACLRRSSIYLAL